MNIEAFKQTLIDSAKLITQKEICISGNLNIQTPWTIYVNDCDGGWVHAMHETCHFLSANKEMRTLKHNLGLPVNDDVRTPVKYLMSEMKAIYFGQLLYLPWFQSLQELNDKYLSYAIYLCEATDKVFVAYDNPDSEDVTVKINDVGLEVWKKQLERKLKKHDTDLIKFYEFLDKTYNEYSKEYVLTHAEQG